MPAESECELNLLDLGRATASEVARRVSAGDCSFRCQLLASRFYEALRQELRSTPGFSPKHALLALAVARCERAAKPGVIPSTVLSELTIAVAMLDRASTEYVETTRRHGPPQLKVIQGGLSLR